MDVQTALSPLGVEQPLADAAQPCGWLDAVLPFSRALGAGVALAFVLARTQSARRLMRQLRGRADAR